MATIVGSSAGTKQAQLSAKINEAVEAGEKFIEVFYDALDKRRQVMAGLYSDASLVTWNGKSLSGASNIMNFYQSLPGTAHRVVTLDCQPVLSSPSTVLISCKGNVLFEGEALEKRFSQDFLLNKEGEVWKIGSDCFRFIDRL